MTFQIIDLDTMNVAAAAGLWADGWHEAHGQIVPPALIALRTPDSFASRLSELLDSTRIAIGDSGVLGLCVIKNDELNQLYVGPTARGQGVAQALMTDAEHRLHDAGHSAGWLACAIGNGRAARFYEKSGWRNAGERVVELETSTGTFPLAIWRFEKAFA